MSIYSKTAAGWVEVAGGAGGADLTSWGRVVGEPEGAVTSAYINLEDGTNWQYWEFNTPGDYEIDLGNGGLFWCLVVGAGSRGWIGNNDGHVAQGQPGQVREGLWEFGPGVHSIKVGDIGTGTADASIGGGSWVGDFKVFNTHWGSANAGRGSDINEDPTPYYSSITGNSLAYAPGSKWREAGFGNELRPGQGGEQKTPNLPEPGTVIIATRIDVEQLAPAPAELAPAPVLGAPVKVSGSEDVRDFIVRQNDGTRKKIYMLPGATGDNGGQVHPENEFEVTLGAGTLNAIMVGAGGTGGYTQTASYTGGGGGAGGVIGTGAHFPVILPIQGPATYTFKVASTTPEQGRNRGDIYAQATTLAVQGETPFTAAVGGGVGWMCNVAGSTPIGSAATSGASGGGGLHATSDVSGLGGVGIPGQGHAGGRGQTSNQAAAGGGYGGPGGVGHIHNGGSGFDLAAAFDLNKSDGPTATFLALVSEDGFIAGGGAGHTGTPGPGGGVGSGGAAKDFTGSGGGSGAYQVKSGNSGAGGCGAVYIITDA